MTDRILRLMVLSAMSIIAFGCSHGRVCEIAITQTETRPNDPQPLRIEIMLPAHKPKFFIPVSYDENVKGVAHSAGVSSSSPYFHLVVECCASVKMEDLEMTISEENPVDEDRVQGLFLEADVSDDSVVFEVPLNIDKERQRFEESLRSEMRNDLEHFDIGQVYEWNASLFVHADFDNRDLEKWLDRYPHAILFCAESERVRLMDWTIRLSVDLQRPPADRNK